MDYSPPGSSVHGTLQARILGWVAISFSSGSSQPRDWIQVSLIVGRRFNLWATNCSGSELEESGGIQSNLFDLVWLFLSVVGKEARATVDFHIDRSGDDIIHKTGSEYHEFNLKQGESKMPIWHSSRNGQQGLNIQVWSSGERSEYKHENHKEYQRNRWKSPKDLCED